MLVGDVDPRRAEDRPALPLEDGRVGVPTGRKGLDQLRVDGEVYGPSATAWSLLAGGFGGAGRCEPVSCCIAIRSFICFSMPCGEPSRKRTLPLPFSATWRIDSVHIENRISDESTLFVLHLARCLRQAAGDLLAEQGDALTAQLGGGALGLGRDADRGARGLGFLGLADQQRVALVGRRGLQVVRRDTCAIEVVIA